MDRALYRRHPSLFHVEHPFGPSKEVGFGVQGRYYELAPQTAHLLDETLQMWPVQLGGRVIEQQRWGRRGPLLEQLNLGPGS